MRKTIMLGVLIALSGAGALAQAKDVTATEQKSPIEASQPAAPAVRDEENRRERRAASSTEHRENRERHGEKEKHGQRH